MKKVDPNNPFPNISKNYHDRTVKNKILLFSYYFIFYIFPIILLSFPSEFDIAFTDVDMSSYIMVSLLFIPLYLLAFLILHFPKDNFKVIKGLILPNIITLGFLLIAGKISSLLFVFRLEGQIILSTFFLAVSIIYFPKILMENKKRSDITKTLNGKHDKAQKYFLLFFLAGFFYAALKSSVHSLGVLQSMQTTEFQSSWVGIMYLISFVTVFTSQYYFLLGKGSNKAKVLINLKK